MKDLIKATDSLDIINMRNGLRKKVKNGRGGLDIPHSTWTNFSKEVENNSQIPTLDNA